MDMYQKRKMRQEKKKENNEKKLDKMNINWEDTTLEKPLLNPYK